MFLWIFMGYCWYLQGVPGKDYGNLIKVKSTWAKPF